MFIHQLSIFMENRPGQMANICRTLAKENINIVTLSLADTAEFGIVRMIVEDYEKAKTVLTAAGHVARVSEVVAVTVPDRPGGMAEVMDVIDCAKVNVEYAYAFAFHYGEKAVLVFKFEDNAAGVKALAAANITMLDATQIAK